jgi:hypothetical protein
MAISSKIGMKVLTIAVGIPVTRVVTKLVEGAWHSLHPNDPPRDADAAGVRWADAIGWAALSAAGVVIAELVTRRGAEETWRTLTGLEPPPPPPTKAEKKLAKAQSKVSEVEA